METHSTYTPACAIHAHDMRADTCIHTDCGECIDCFDDLQRQWSLAMAKPVTRGTTEALWHLSCLIERCGNALLAAYGGTFE